MENEPECIKKTYKILGTKDFINLKLTGNFATDYSYASGSGVYDLNEWNYSEKLIELSGIPFELLPEIKASTDIIGQLAKESAATLGLHPKVKVVCGGVDNSCMAAGSRNIKEGRIYTSLGTCAWIAVSSNKPVLGDQVRPFVFAHVIPGMFTSAVAINSAGSALKWIRDNLCADFSLSESKTGENIYNRMTDLASKSPAGSNKLLFNPSLSGGSTFHTGRDIRGGYIGLDLAHNRSDLIRSAMEGIAMDLRLALDAFRDLGIEWQEMLLSGGGSRSKLWRQIFADVYNTTVVKTNIDQGAASLGAAAVAAVGVGLWKDFSRIDKIHEVEEVTKPILENADVYEKLLPIFKEVGYALAEAGDKLSKIN